MTLAATGNLALTLYNLETLVASSARFRTECGAADVAAARARVHWPRYEFPDDEDQIERPFAWIRLKGGWTARKDDSGGGGFWHSMPLGLMLEVAQDKDADHKDREIAALNFFGEVIAEIETLSHQEGYLMVTEITMEEYMLSDAGEKTAYAQAMLNIQVN